MTYLGEALLAIHEDGIPLAGVFCWGALLSLSSRAVRYADDASLYARVQR